MPIQKDLVSEAAQTQYRDSETQFLEWDIAESPNVNPDKFYRGIGLHYPVLYDPGATTTAAIPLLAPCKLAARVERECRGLKERGCEALCSMAGAHCAQEEGEEEDDFGGELPDGEKAKGSGQLCADGSDAGSRRAAADKEDASVPSPQY